MGCRTVCIRRMTSRSKDNGTEGVVGRHNGNHRWEVRVDTQKKTWERIKSIEENGTTTTQHATVVSLFTFVRRLTELNPSRHGNQGFLTTGLRILRGKGSNLNRLGTETGVNKVRRHRQSGKGTLLRSKSNSVMSV